MTISPCVSGQNNLIAVSPVFNKFSLSASYFSGIVLKIEDIGVKRG